MGGQRLKFIFCRDEFKTCEASDLGGKGFSKAGLGVEARADRRAALGQRQQSGQGGAYALKRIFYLCRIAGKFLSQCQRRCVLQMRAPDFNNIGPCACLVRQRGV